MSGTSSQPSIRKPNRWDISLLLSLTVIWASAFLVIKVVVPDTGPLWLATMRVVIAFLALLPIVIYQGIELARISKGMAFTECGYGAQCGGAIFLNFLGRAKH